MHARPCDRSLGARLGTFPPNRQQIEVGTVSETGRKSHFAPRLILAAGTVERIIPFEGWTLPGIIGLGAATLLLKSQRILPGRSTVVAGAGPLLMAVAAGILKGGGEVAAIVDLNDARDWLAATPALARRPWMEAVALDELIARRRVPYFPRHALVAADGSTSVQQVTLCPVNSNWAPRETGRRRLIAADAIAVGHGLTP